jgi:hypothetical protein
MKKLLLCTIICLLTVIGFAQNVSINDETDVVLINNVPAFKLEKINNRIVSFDMVWKTLEDKPIAYLTLTQGIDRMGTGTTAFYTIRFAETNSNAPMMIENPFALRKNFAKRLYNANILINGEINKENIKTFILQNGGWIDTYTDVTNTNYIIDEKDIVLQNDRVYYKQELVATYELNTQNNTMSISFNNPTKSKKLVANKTADGFDWIIETNNNKHTIMYNAEKPLISLSKYLLEKGYL